MSDRDGGVGAGPGVLDHVGQRLLDHSVRGEVQGGGEVSDRALGADLNRETRPPQVSGQPVQGLDPRWGLVVGVGLVAAQRAEDAPDLGEGGPAGRLHGEQRHLCLARVSVDHVRSHAGLQGDHTQGVPDDVVQLLGDPQPLVADRASGLLDPGAFGKLGAFGEQQQVEAPGQGASAKPEGTGEHRTIGDQLGWAHLPRDKDRERHQDREHIAGGDERGPHGAPGGDSVSGQEQTRADHSG